MSEPGAKGSSVVLVHHADAVGPGVDAQRPLSAVGRAQAEWLAEYAKTAGVRPAMILHSGKLRARQTAECFHRVCNPLAEFRMARGLRPDDSPERMRDALALETAEILIVSHMPILPALARLLDSDVETFPLHGLMVFDRTGETSYEERWRIRPPGL